MEQHRVWDRSNPMPPGREFEAYHFVDTAAQPVFYHNHPHYEIFFYLQGHSRMVSTSSGKTTCTAISFAV